MAKRKSRARRVTRRKRAGAPVGAVPGIVTAPPGAHPSTARLIAYDDGQLVERTVSDPATMTEELERHRVLWVDVAGLGDGPLIEAIGRVFDLHPLALEDVVHTHQRAKVEPYPFGHYVVVRMPRVDEERGLDLEQVSIFFGPRFVVTFQEREGDCFEAVRERLRRARGRARRCGPDYLAYAILDAIVDSYFPHVEAYGDRLEELEDRILASPDQRVVGELHTVKRDLLMIRRAVWPLREAVNTLAREEHENISEDTRLYLRDVYDHTVQLVELTETQREMASGMLDVYLSSVSNRMNEIMKVLTIIATIFIPLSFVASLYGMNFEHERSPWNMPELDWRYGYPFALAIMALIAGGLLLFFRRKRWI